MDISVSETKCRKDMRNKCLYKWIGGRGAGKVVLVCDKGDVAVAEKFLRGEKRGA